MPSPSHPVALSRTTSTQLRRTSIRLAIVVIKNLLPLRLCARHPQSHSAATTSRACGVTTIRARLLGGATTQTAAVCWAKVRRTCTPCFCRLRAHSRAHASVAGSVEDFAKDKKLSLERCAGQCNHWQPERKDKVEVLPLLGVLDGKACFCGDQAQLALATAKARARPLEECVLVSCSGASNEKCGGVDRLAVFNYSVTPGVSPWLPHV